MYHYLFKRQIWDSWNLLFFYKHIKETMLGTYHFSLRMWRIILSYEDGRIKILWLCVSQRVWDWESVESLRNSVYWRIFCLSRQFIKSFFFPTYIAIWHFLLSLATFFLRHIRSISPVLTITSPSSFRRSTVSLEYCFVFLIQFCRYFQSNKT